MNEKKAVKLIAKGGWGRTPAAIFLTPCPTRNKTLCCLLVAACLVASLSAAIANPSLLEMSEKLDKNDQMDFSTAIDKARTCTRSRDFSCAETQLNKASNLAGNGAERATLTATRNGLASAKEQVAREKQEQANREATARQAQASSTISSSACYGIKDYGMQQVCLKGPKNDACYGIKDFGLQQVCLKGAKTDACYGIKDFGLQQVCLKGTETDACYGIKDYGQQQSCRTFNDTTMWVLLKGHGYTPE